MSSILKEAHFNRISCQCEKWTWETTSGAHITSWKFWPAEDISNQFVTTPTDLFQMAWVKLNFYSLWLNCANPPYQSELELSLNNQSIPRNILCCNIFNSERIWLFDLRPAFCFFHQISLRRQASTEYQGMKERSQLISGDLLWTWYYYCQTEFWATKSIYGDHNSDEIMIPHTHIN